MIGVVVNPHAKKVRGNPRHVERLRKVLSGWGEVVVTEELDAVPAALEHFAKQGYRYWVADGGDGALHWMINEAVRVLGPEFALKTPVYLPTNGGTIDFVAHALGHRGRSTALLRWLVRQLQQECTPNVRALPSLRVSLSFADQSKTPVERLAFAVGAAGYGANFYGPYYAGEWGRGTPRILMLMLWAFSAGATRSVFRGGLARWKPEVFQRAEYDFLRPAKADVRLNGKIFDDDQGNPLDQFTVLHAGSIPVNLGGVFRVFPQADAHHMHVHVGALSPLEVLRVMPYVLLGRPMRRSIGQVYDGPAQTLHISHRAGPALVPCLDGELWEDVHQIHIDRGPLVPMVAP